MTAAPAAGETAPLTRRALSLAYELLLITALALAAMIPFVLLTSGWEASFKRLLSQAWLAAVLAAYFVPQWVRGGQTLAMKTWRLKLVTRTGAPPTAARALCRYVFALGGTVLFGIGFLWALVDRERQFLHDRLAGTKIICVPAARSSPPPR